MVLKHKADLINIIGSALVSSFSVINVLVFSKLVRKHRRFLTVVIDLVQEVYKN